MKHALAVLALGLTAVICGCAPAVSIRPLYTDGDLKKPTLEPRIEGEWVSPDTDQHLGEPGLRWKVTSPPGAAYGAYSVEYRLAKPEPGKDDDEVTGYDVLLVAIADKLFFDAELSGQTQGRAGVAKFVGLVPGHVVGRIWVQQDFLRIALLNSEWVKDNSPEGFREIIPDKYADTSIITGSTQELRDFVVRNADNPKALAYIVYLCRPGTDCGTRASEDALARSPDDDAVLEAASEFFFARGNYARAVALRQHWVELDPEDFTHHAALGEALLFNRDFSSARRELARVQELTLGEHPKPVGHDAQSAYASASEDVVWSYFLEGKYAETVNAAKKYRPGKEHLSANPILLSYFSLVRLGCRAEAESLLKDGMTKFKGSAEEDILLLDTYGRVSEGFPYSGLKEDQYSAPRSEAVWRVWFFSALQEIATGRPDRARDRLGEAASEHSESVIGFAAKIELERLGSEPKKKGKD